MSRTARDAAARRDWGSDDEASGILHVDMDAFFAEVELLSRPALRGLPVIVGERRRGVVLSATYEARASGVHSAMPMHLARATCPAAVVVPPDHVAYREVSRRVMAILASVTPVLEQVSIDEAFLDVSGARRRLGSAVQIAEGVRRRIRAELGLAASVGIASTKLVAKLASSHAKPDGLLLVPHAAAVDFLHSLPVRALWGVGERTGERLESHGIRTVHALATVSIGELEAIVGPGSGRRLMDLAWGRDPRAVEPVRQERSIGTELTFDEDVTDRAVLGAVVLEQADRVAARLRRAGLLARTVSIKVRMADFSTLTRSQTLAAPTDLARDLCAAARGLLAGVRLAGDGVRLLGLRAEGLLDMAGTPVQDPFAVLSGPDWRGAETVIDRVRERYGTAAVRAGSLVRSASTAPAAGELS